MRMERINLLLNKADREKAKKKAIKEFGIGQLSPLVRWLIKMFIIGRLDMKK